MAFEDKDCDTLADMPKIESTDREADPGGGSESHPDAQWMQLALDQARHAEACGEVPVGAVIVQATPEGLRVIAVGQNTRETARSPCGHAEINAIEAAAHALGRWRLTGCTLYVTLEPCVMCAGAIVHSRLERVVYGATDPKAGAVQSLYQILSDSRLNHRPEITAGVLASECAAILSQFFSRKRAAARSNR